MPSAEPATAAPPTTKDDPTMWRVDDALWAELRPLLVLDKPRKQPGRPRNDARPICNGLIWLARTGGQWAALPREFGAKSTVNDRFLEWVAHGRCAQAWARLLAAYDDEVGLDWAWRAADGCIIKAPLGKRGGLARRRRRGAPPPTAGSAAGSGTC